MWKMAQSSPKKEPKIVPTRPVAAQVHNSRKMSSPAYMLPYNRSECDRGLERYSIALNSRLSGNTLPPNGEQNSSCIQPPQPLAATEKYSIRNQTASASEEVVWTSAVGTTLKPCSDMWWVPRAMMSTGRKSIAFMISTQTN